ncbi:hypothetical protein VTO42DRAFT_6028 [Malbranchea cinnamomea]
MNGHVHFLMALGASPALILLLPVLTFVAVPLTIFALFTAPLAVILLYSRVWLVYIDYFLTLFYRAMIRPDTEEVALQSPYPPEDIARRYNVQNLRQYGYFEGHPTTSEQYSPPILYSPKQGRAQRDLVFATGGEAPSKEVTRDHGEPGAGESPDQRVRTGMNADMDSVGAWEDLASIAQQHSRRRPRSSTSGSASAYVQLDNPAVGILPAIAAQHSGQTHRHHRRRRSSGVRYADVIRLQEELEHKQRGQP